MFVSLEQFLLPDVTKSSRKPKTAFKLPFSAFKNNAPLFFFVLGYLLVNIGLFVSRVFEYKDAFTLYMLARAAGKFLNQFVVNQMNSFTFCYKIRPVLELQLCFCCGFDVTSHHYLVKNALLSFRYAPTRRSCLFA